MPKLDAEELLHLGLRATQNDNPEGAIEYFKQCLAQSPDHPQATYLLGAVYAQIGMYDRARDFLQSAITINPHEFTGIFQLGLLHLTSGDVDSARRVWDSLNVLADDHPLYLFKSAMLCMVIDDFSQCIDLIERGLRANTVNDSLNDDMRRVLTTVEALKAEAKTEDSAESAAGTSHLVLSGYQQAQQKESN